MALHASSISTAVLKLRNYESSNLDLPFQGCFGYRTTNLTATFTAKGKETKTQLLSPNLKPNPMQLPWQSPGQPDTRPPFQTDKRGVLVLDLHGTKGVTSQILQPRHSSDHESFQALTLSAS